MMTFDDSDLYPTLSDRAAAICYSLVMNHPIVDGNKRIGHAALECFLMLKGYELDCETGAAEQFFLSLAAGMIQRTELKQWIEDHSKTFPGESTT